MLLNRSDRVYNVRVRFDARSFDELDEGCLAKQARLRSRYRIPSSPEIHDLLVRVVAAEENNKARKRRDASASSAQPPRSSPRSSASPLPSESTHCTPSSPPFLEARLAIAFPTLPKTKTPKGQRLLFVFFLSLFPPPRHSPPVNLSARLTAHSQRPPFPTTAPPTLSTR